MHNHNFSYEIIFIDDGSSDGSWQWVEKQPGKHHIKAIKFRRNYGKSAALNVGFEHTSGQVVITMDADLQDSPDEIPIGTKWLRMEVTILFRDGKERFDPISKDHSNQDLQWRYPMDDWYSPPRHNCGLKAYRSDVVKVSKHMVRCIDTHSLSQAKGGLSR